jgi:hypothetical protein
VYRLRLPRRNVRSREEHVRVRRSEQREFHSDDQGPSHSEGGEEALGGWDEPLVLVRIIFAALLGYAWLDPARRRSSTGTPSTSGTEVSKGSKCFG